MVGCGEGLFVWFGLNVAFNLFQSYRDGVWMLQGVQCSLLECCLTEISRPRHWHYTQSHYTDTKLTSSRSTFLILSAILKGWGSNPQPPGHKAVALPLNHCVAKVSCILHHWGVQLCESVSCSSFFPVLLFHLLYYLFYLFFATLWETTQNDPQGLTCS